MASVLAICPSCSLGANARVLRSSKQETRLVEHPLLKRHLNAGNSGMFQGIQLAKAVRNVTRTENRRLCQPRAIAGEGEQGEEGREAAKKASSSIEALEATIGRGRRRQGAQEKKTEALPFEEPKKKKKSLDEMSSAEKIYELWLGEKGGLYWLNRLSWGAVISLGVAWIIFRFVGPQLGLYELESPLVPPSQAF